MATIFQRKVIIFLFSQFIHFVMSLYWHRGVFSTSTQKTSVDITSRCPYTYLFRTGKIDRASNK